MVNCPDSAGSTSRTCSGTATLPLSPANAFDPTPYIDQVTNCNYNIQVLGFVEQLPGMRYMYHLLAPTSVIELSCKDVNNKNQDTSNEAGQHLRDRAGGRPAGVRQPAELERQEREEN
eukprot:SAG31_NODE_366_length_16817_cov_17.317921_18_plen_118_part_00